MIRKMFFTALVVCASLSTFAQNNEDGTSFKANGKPIVNIFTDFRYSIQDGKTNPAFEVTRAYFGYIYNFTPNFSTKVLLDVTSNNKSGTFPSAYSAYIKYAFGEYTNKIFTVDFGMIDTNLFGIQETMWGRRYIMKAILDINEFGSRADLGVGVKIQASPRLSFDAQIVNGEGYQKVQADSTVKISAGISYEPVKHLFFRLYGDYMKKNTEQSSFSAMVAYKNERLTLGGEYDYQKGHKMIKGHNFHDFSIWGAFRASHTTGIFARYDYTVSDKTTGEGESWNGTKDGQTYAAGVEFFPVKGIAISPNIQISNPKLKSGKQITNILVNFAFSL